MLRCCFAHDKGIGICSTIIKNNITALRRSSNGVVLLSLAASWLDPSMQVLFDEEYQVQKRFQPELEFFFDHPDPIKPLLMATKLTIISICYTPGIPKYIHDRANGYAEGNALCWGRVFWMPSIHMQFSVPCHQAFICTLLAAARFSVKLPNEMWLNIFEHIQQCSFLLPLPLLVLLPPVESQC